jgi:3,4-dihydroxy 2-butanone 4-phosphate synthase/GTP cyclohydrolase II
MIPFETFLEDAKRYAQEKLRPLVCLSYAQSLDGSLTFRRGYPMALSGQESLKLTHQLRSAHDAIMVGIGTVLADDPCLSVRHIEGKSPQPVILDSRLRTPIDSKLLTESPSKPWIITTPSSDQRKKSALEAAGGRILFVPPDSDGCVELSCTLEYLAELGISSLMVEGGAQVITSFLKNRLVDWVAITIAPVYVGGLNVVESLLNNHDIGKHNAFPRLREFNCEKVGGDLVIWGRLSSTKK